MRQTSIETYHAVKNSGLLSELRVIVYDCVYKYQPMTQGEAWDIVKQFRKMNSSGCITSRFAELKHLGVIVEVGVRPCKITGRNCIEWITTNNLPVAYERKTKDQIIKELKEQIEILKKQLGNQVFQKELFQD